jgi:predicted acylesterase/phospholipase RssA
MTNVKNDFKSMAGDTYEDTRCLLPKFHENQTVKVGTWLRGVFEGGGAKAVAYCGALEAVEEHNCWFEAVAGSSAGAITAALIAAGYSPRELEEPMVQLLKLLQFPGLRKAFCSLRNKGEIFQHEAFIKKLDELLRRKCSRFDDQLGDEELTFQKLHNATGVDLYVVAADVSRREPIVFHHRYTPKCQVADAVVASASIPFAFDGGMLTAESTILHPLSKTGREDDIRVFRTILDGGVWTNFPMFVFKDSAFHEYMTKALGLDREADDRSAGPIVGFVLHELVDDQGGDKDETARSWFTKAAYKGAQFERGTPPKNRRLAPIEKTDLDVDIKDEPTLSLRSGVKSKFGPDVGRWPNPQKECYRTLLVYADKILLNAASWLAPILLLAFFAIELLLLVAPGLALWEKLRESMSNGELDFGWVLAAIIYGVIYAGQLAAVVMLFLVPMFVNLALQRPARRVIYGLARTLVATPGTAPWEHLHPDVITLEIPSYLRTLKVPDDEQRDEVIRRAKEKTIERLPEILKKFNRRCNPWTGRIRRCYDHGRHHS